MEAALDHPFVRQLSTAANQYTDNRRVIGAPYCSDASKLAKIGIPTVVFGPGDIEQAHSKDEWIELSQVVDATAALIDLVMQYGEGPEEEAKIWNP
jgi:acetylornithine deacetylase/succinyl-diaminopimelate desuccinylase-like protein